MVSKKAELATHLTLPASLGVNVRADGIDSA